MLTQAELTVQPSPNKSDSSAAYSLSAAIAAVKQMCRTYIQAINDDLVDCVLISSHSCGNLPPVSQPCILAIVDQSWVIIQLVVQDHPEAVAGIEADDKHVALKGGGEAVQVVAADALCLWGGELQTYMCTSQKLHPCWKLCSKQYVC